MFLAVGANLPASKTFSNFSLETIFYLNFLVAVLSLITDSKSLPLKLGIYCSTLIFNSYFPLKFAIFFIIGDL